jgi:hypothetical protein
MATAIDADDRALRAAGVEWEISGFSIAEGDDPDQLP